MKKIAIAMFCFITFSACGGSICKDAAHTNDIQCVVQNSVVDCSVGAGLNAIKTIEPVVFALVMQLVGSGNGSIDWNALGSSLSSLGLTDSICILTEIENKLTAKATASPKAMNISKSFADGFSAYRAERLPPGTKIKLPDGSVK